MDDRPAWGTPPRNQPGGFTTGPADALPEDDRLADLYASVVDTGRRKPRAGGTAPSGRWRVVGALVAVVVVCAAVGWLLLRPGGTDPSSAGATGAVDPADAWSASAAPQVVADLVEVAGGTQFVAVFLYAGYASAVAPTAPGATTTDRYAWRDGKAERSGPEGVLDPDELFDVTTVDWTAIEGFVSQVPELSGIDSMPSSVYVERAVAGGASADAQLSLSLSDDYGRSANLIADQAGQIVWMSSDIEGSPASEWAAAGLLQTDRTRQVADDLVAVAGSTQFVSVRIFNGHASAYALNAPGDSVDYLSWSRGFASTSSSTSTVNPAALFDVTTVDWTSVAGLVAQAGDLTGIGAPMLHGSVEVSRAGSGLVYEVYLDDDSVTGSVAFDATGQVVSMRGGVPGSASDQWDAAH